MVNDKNLINKLTKGFKLKINKKKKSNWRTLNSKESLPPTPSDDLMLYSDTEAELYQAKINVVANRSFVSYNNSNSFNNESGNFNTNNILAGLNSNDNLVGRSKTAYTRQNANPYTYKSNHQSQSTQNKNQYLYPNNLNENHKNTFQTVVGTSPNSNSQPIPINKTSSSTSSTPNISAPNSPLSFDSSDTYVNDIKINPNNPFITNINNNTSSNIHPKATTAQINTHLNITTNNLDPAYSHLLVSPIEFDGSGNAIKSKSNTNTTTNINSTSLDSTNNNGNNNNNNNNNNNSPSKDFPVKSKSVKKIKPLITFDTPPVVSPMAPGSDTDETGHRKRGGKKSKKYSKKRSTPAFDMNEGSRDIGKKSSNINGNMNSSSKSSSVNIIKEKRMNQRTEEDDDVPLGIIQYKCLSSLLQESAPPNISSLQSNKKSYKSSQLKDNYGYISPFENSSKEKYAFPKFIHYPNYYHENYVI